MGYKTKVNGTLILPLKVQGITQRQIDTAFRVPLATISCIYKIRKTEEDSPKKKPTPIAPVGYKLGRIA